MATGNFLTVSHVTDKIYQHLGFSTTISASIAFTNPGGVVWKDPDVYWGSFGGSTKKGTGFTGTVQESYATPGGSLIYGMDFLGADVIFANDVSVTKIYRQLGFSATVQSSITMAGESFYGIAQDGTNLLSNSNPSGTGKARRHDGFSTTITESFTMLVTAGLQLDITWDGTDLYSVALALGYKRHSGFSSTIAESIALESGVTSTLGMDWDGFPSAVAAVDHGLILRLSMTF